MKQVFGFFFVALCFLGLANASLIPVLDSGQPTAVAGGFQFTYTATLSSDESLNPSNTSGSTCTDSMTSGASGSSTPCGTFFTIYDIPGFVSANVSAGLATQGWAESTYFTGLTPSNATPQTGDSNVVQNAVFSYTGAVVNGPASYDGFNVVSIYSMKQTGSFTFQATKTAFPAFPDQGTGPVQIPSGVPEPASMLLIGGGLIGFAFLRRRLAR
jgi:hypothetical protein